MSRRRKLEAIANDPAAAPAERAFARKLLAEMEVDSVVLDLRESWEVALVHALVEKHALAETPEPGGSRVRLEGANLDDALGELVPLHAALDAVLVSATAGFLAAHFPRAGAREREPGPPPDAVLQAAFSIARRTKAAPVPAPKLIEAKTRQIEAKTRQG